MPINNDDLYSLIPGTQVIVTACEGSDHDDGVGCVCKLKGTIHTMGTQYKTPFAGTPTWWLTPDKRVRLSEVTLVRKD